MQYKIDVKCRDLHGGIRLCDSLEFVTSEKSGKPALNQTR